VKTKTITEVISGKSKKIHRETELGKAISAFIAALFFMALYMAASLFCNLVCT